MRPYRRRSANTEYVVFARRLASGERQGHYGKQYNLAHAIPPSRFLTAKKLPAMCVEFAVAYQFTVHGLGTFA
jgi:hypothetical protein